MNLGWTPPDAVWARPLLKGLSALKRPGRPTRMAVTPDLLFVMKKKLKTMDWSMEKKRLVWCVATWAFIGALRGSEILPESKHSFDPDQTLLGEDVLVEVIDGRPAVVLTLKCTKEKRQPNSTSVVELYQMDKWFCPIDSFRKLLKERGRVPEKSQPLFMLEGVGYTKQMMNEDLKLLFSDVVDYKQHKIQTHSFRYFQLFQLFPL